MPAGYRTPLPALLAALLEAAINRLLAIDEARPLRFAELPRPTLNDLAGSLFRTETKDNRDSQGIGTPGAEK